MTTPSQYAEMNDLALVQEVMQDSSPLLELGSTGLKRAGGYVDEEFLPALRGRKAVQVYREMGDNDAITGALLYTITQLLRNVDWPVIPAGKGKEAAEHAKFVEQCMGDMTHTWDEFIVEALSFLQYGWAWHEIVYKKRVGPWQKTGQTRSKYTDGMLGWRRLPIRAQETLQRWVFDEDGNAKGMIQLAPPEYKMRTIPIERSLLFRYGAHKGSPEGRSMLRNSYRSWFYKKRLEEFESVGVERDLAGLPMVTVPSDYLRAAKQSEHGKMVEAMKKMVRSVRRNEQEGIVFPAAYDPDTKQPLFKFELLGSGGARQFSTNELIQRYEQRQLMTVLADWIVVGHQGSTGTYNLHVDKTGIFRAGANSITQSIADIMNRHAIPRLFAMNGIRPEELPTIKPTNVDAPDLGQLGQFLGATSQLGFTWGPDADMERYLRHAAGMPELADDDYAKRRQLARKTESTRMAETQTAYLAARSQLAQVTAEQEMAAEGQPTPDQAAMMGQAQQGAQQQQAQGAQAEQAAQMEQQKFALEQEKAAYGVAGQIAAQQNPTTPTGNGPRGAPVKGRKQR